MKNNYITFTLIALATTLQIYTSHAPARPVIAVTPKPIAVAPKPTSKPAIHEPVAARTASKAGEITSTSNIGRITTEAAAASKATQTRPTEVTLEKPGASINLERKPTSAPEIKPTITIESEPITASELMKKIQDKQKATQTPEQKVTAILISSKATAIAAIEKAFVGNQIQLSSYTKVALSRTIDAKDWHAFNSEINRMLTVASRKGPNKIDSDAIYKAIIAAETANIGNRLQSSLKLTLAHATVTFHELLQPFKKALENQSIKKSLQGQTLDSSTPSHDSFGFHDIPLQPNKSGLPEEHASNLNNFLEQTNKVFLADGAKRQKAQAEIDAQIQGKIQKEYDQGELELRDIWKKQDAEAEAAKAAKVAEAAKVNTDQREFLGTDSKPKKEFPLEGLSKQSIAKTPRAPIIETSGFLLSEAAPIKQQERTARPKIEIPTDSSSPEIVTTQTSAVTSQNPLQGKTITQFAARYKLEKLPENPTPAQLEKFSANVVNKIKTMEPSQQKALLDTLSKETSVSAHATDAHSTLTSNPKTAIPSTSDSSSGFVLTEAPAARTKVVAQKESLVLPQENTNAIKPTMPAHPTEGMTVYNYPDKLGIKKLSQTPETAAIKQFGTDFMAAFEKLSPAQKEIAAKSFLFTNGLEGVRAKAVFINDLPINLLTLPAAEQGGFNNIVKRMGDPSAPVEVTKDNYATIVETLKTIVTEMAKNPSLGIKITASKATNLDKLPVPTGELYKLDPTKDMNPNNFLEKLNIERIHFGLITHASNVIVPYYNNYSELNTLVPIFNEKFTKLSNYKQRQIVAESFLGIKADPENPSAAANQALKIINLPDKHRDVTDFITVKDIIDPIISRLSDPVVSYELTQKNYETIMPMIKNIVNRIGSNLDYPGFNPSID